MLAGSEVAPGAEAGTRRSSFFLGASLLMTLVVFLGFLPSYYFRFHFRTKPLPVYLIVHGAIMTSWQLFFVVQTVLIKARRTDVHRKLGLAGAGLAVAVVVMGTYVTLRLPASFAANGVNLPFPVENLVFGNLFGFALFAGLVTAAVALRRDRESHKRLIYWAGVITTGPAVTPTRSLGEMIAPYMPATFPPELMLGWVAWVALLVHDWSTARRFHPVTIVGGLLILFIMPALLDWFLLIPGIGAWVR